MVTTRIRLTTSALFGYLAPIFPPNLQDSAGVSRARLPQARPWILIDIFTSKEVRYSQTTKWLPTQAHGGLTAPCLRAIRTSYQLRATRTAATLRPRRCLRWRPRQMGTGMPRLVTASPSRTNTTSRPTRRSTANHHRHTHRHTSRLHRLARHSTHSRAQPPLLNHSSPRLEAPSRALSRG